MLMGIISSGLLQMYQSDIALVHAQHIFAHGCFRTNVMIQIQLTRTCRTAAGGPELTASSSLVSKNFVRRATRPTMYLRLV